MKTDKKKYIDFIPGIIVILFFIIIYIFNGIYPFGGKTVIQGDLNIYVDTINFLLDVIKNKSFGSLIFTNLIFSGNSNIILTSWFTPFFLLYMLCNNASYLMYFMSYIIAIKCIFCAYTSYFCFKKLFGIENNKLNCLFSIVYAFSAYVLINYSTLMWIDIVILFPLLILALRQVFFQHKFVWYTILLSLCIITSYQLAYMIIFSILATSLLAIKIFQIPEKKKTILTLGIGTIVGILIASIYFYPVSKIYTSSARTNATVLINDYFWSTKLAYLLFSSILLYGSIQAFHYRKVDKNIKFLIYAIFVTGIIPIVFEGVNIIWHGGQYDSFPFRYGFIPLFYMNLLTIYHWKEYSEKEESKNKITSLYNIDLMCGIVSLCGISCIISYTNPTFQIYTIVLLLLVVYNFFMYRFYYNFWHDPSRIKKTERIFAIVLLEICILGLGFFGSKELFKDYEHADATIKNENAILKKLGEKLDDSGYRYKDIDNYNLLLETSPLYTKLPSLESWNLSTADQVYTHRKLGYSSLVLRLNSAGGTILSDAIMGNKYVISKHYQDPNLYHYIDETNNEIKLYEINETFPFGIVYNSNNNIEEIPQNLDVFDSQNWIYNNLFSREGNILEKLRKNEDYTYISKNIDIQKNGNLDYQKNTDGKYEEPYYIEYTIDINKKSILYMLYDGKLYDDTYVAFWIELENDSKWQYYEKSEDKYYYPNYFDNNLVDLGVYEKGIAKVRFCFWKKMKHFDINSIQFGLLDLEKFEQLNDNLITTSFRFVQNNVNISVSSPDRTKNLFLPLAYDKNIIATNNGKEIKIQRAMNGLISIPLEEGNNRIKLTYTNPNIKTGLVLTIVGIVLLIGLTLLKETILNIKFLQNIAYILFIIITIGFYLYVYGYGIISTFIS